MNGAAGKGVPQYDWSSCARTTAKEALRYSRFVSLMKRLLSLGAFLIIAAVLAFFSSSVSRVSSACPMKCWARWKTTSPWSSRA